MTTTSPHRPLRIGYVALTDVAPLAVACEHGYFERHGVEVELSREVGWATIREKIIYGELDAAHAPAPMLWSIRLGIESAASRVLSAFVFNHNGNAITLSTRLWEAGVRDGATLKTEARRRIGERKLCLGVVFPHSSHNVLLRRWLAATGLIPDRDVRIVVVPPAQMVRNLAAGTIDGFCAGEPYNTLAVQGGHGWIATTSAALQPDWPEKVLLVTERFAFDQPARHLALVAALTSAAAWCDAPANRPELVSILSRQRWVGQPGSTLLPALCGTLDCGMGRTSSEPGFLSFHGGGANVPTIARALLIQRELSEAHLLPRDIEREIPHRVFREDLHRQALTLKPHELISS
ncbi:CmpA/NrtA family ABC transporter substrate-binding protein [Nibricoccus sp. IMCC34717]|uniref:CmpA/NrtA family ABC transporter substrate-binding protein n=1 Tax=Nibricoccus sp. IMCC34717 TaxID=3034021 RepID=UPI00384DAF0F